MKGTSIQSFDLPPVREFDPLTVLKEKFSHSVDFDPLLPPAEMDHSKGEFEREESAETEFDTLLPEAMEAAEAEFDPLSSLEAMQSAEEFDGLPAAFEPLEPTPDPAFWFRYGSR